ncbi:hypothetical protein GWK47_037088 [Chionoecetes opilio]|uniref:Uncharacterized protein n=1 Tax=Chionoecetes opilio TaxID=41210 RepID=A0A8J5CZF8_CHIOP|nr:hypothetical protein GWK47_037088 [Chionoecetes opilio]
MARSTRKQTELFLLAHPLKPSARLSFQQGKCFCGDPFCHGIRIARTIEKLLSTKSFRVWERAHIPVVPLRSIMKKLETLVEVRSSLEEKKRNPRGQGLRRPPPGTLWRHCSTSQPLPFFPMIHLKQKEKGTSSTPQGAGGKW